MCYNWILLWLSNGEYSLKINISWLLLHVALQSMREAWVLPTLHRNWREYTEGFLLFTCFFVIKQISNLLLKDLLLTDSSYHPRTDSFDKLCNYAHFLSPSLCIILLSPGLKSKYLFFPVLQMIGWCLYKNYKFSHHYLFKDRLNVWRCHQALTWWHEATVIYGVGWRRIVYFSKTVYLPVENLMKFKRKINLNQGDSSSVLLLYPLTPLKCSTCHYIDKLLISFPPVLRCPRHKLHLTSWETYDYLITKYCYNK